MGWAFIYTDGSIMRSNVHPNHEIDAAWGHLMPHLGAVKKGDDIDDSWVESISLINSARRLQGRITSYLHSMGMEVQRRGKTLHVCTDQEQVHAAKRHDTSAHRQHKRAYHAARGVERSELPTVLQREADHVQNYSLRQIEAHEQHQKRTKALMGAPEPRPLLKAVDDVKK